MYRSIKELIGYDVQAADGAAGSVTDFFVDEQEWVLRYLVVDTGNWLPGRKVLLSTEALGSPDWRARAFPVKHTRDDIRGAPGIDTDRPVSRQMEQALFDHYQWAPYWNQLGTIGAPLALPVQATQPGQEAQESNDDPHLRSIRELLGYSVASDEEDLGVVDDFIARENDWLFPLFVADTGGWLPGRKALVPTGVIRGISVADSLVRLTVGRGYIENAPPFDPGEPINAKLETQLYDYYGRPVASAGAGRQ